MAGGAAGEPAPGLPEPLAPVDVAEFLEPYGFNASNHLLWRGQPPELSIKVTSHAAAGKHTHYHLECALARTRDSDRRLTWRAERRLAHLREGLHDPLKKALGSSYQTYFAGVHFAHHLRPAGTTARLDAWCQRLAYCISMKLAPPEIAAAALRVLGAPDLSEHSGEEHAERQPQARAPRAALADPLGLADAVGGAASPFGAGLGLGMGLGLGFEELDPQAWDPDKDGLASEGASASTADPCGGLAASLHAAAGGGGASPFGASGTGSFASSEEGSDDEAWDADAVLQRAPPGAASESLDSLGFDPYGGGRRQVPLQ